MATEMSVAHLMPRGLRAVAVVLLALAGSPLAAQDRDDDRGSRRVEVVPYLEAAQVLSAELNNGGDVLTYSVIAAGVDAAVRTRGAEAQVSVRYEHRIAWDDDIGDNDVISGIARGRVDVVPGAVSLEGGALAARSRIDGRGAAPTNLIGGADNVTQVYALYAGPTLTTHIGDIGVGAAYRFGYTKVENRDVDLPPGAQRLDVFDDSTSHAFTASIGQKPRDLPFGWSLSGGYAREDTSQLDQRFEDVFVRADVTIPLTVDLAAVGGIGYEDIEISERDAVRDANGVPVRGPNGRLVTDRSAPRLLSYDQDGLYWDVGVLWRPSRRTSLEARIGRRYDSTTYYGSFSYAPSERTAFNVNAYDLVTGFGSRLTDNLSTLPTQFRSSRNPLSGDLNPCVFGGASSGCFNDALLSVASSAFRTRGITAAFSTERAGWQHGLALGYSRRRFFASDSGALAGFDQTLDQIYFGNYYVTRNLDERSSIDANVYVAYLKNDFLGGTDVLGLGANAGYYRTLARRLTGSVAIGIDGYDPEGLESSIVASALLGLRYTFD